MTYTPIRLAFSGLDCTSDPVEVGLGKATALVNLDPDTPGRARTRPGRAYVTANDSATFSANVIHRVVRNHSAPTYTAAASDGTFAVYNGTTVNTGSVTCVSTTRPDIFVDSATTALVIDDTGLRQWDNVAHTFTSVITGTNTAGPGFITYCPRNGRYVIATPPNRVRFSDVGAASGWSNFVDIGVGTSEWITGIAALGDLILVFMETTAYVFYGEGTTSAGTPIFNYRTVSLGDRIPPNGPPGRMGSDGDSVYYVASRGLYRTAGDAPQYLSVPLDAVFRSEVSSLTGFTTANTFAVPTRDKVYIGGADAASTLVLDKTTGQWSTYDLPATAMASGDSPRSVYVATGSAFNTSPFRLSLLSPASTTDPGGAAISWSYTTGDLESPSATRATLREVELWGSGAATVSVSTDDGAFDTGSALTLGSFPAVQSARQRTARRGSRLAVKLAGTGSALLSKGILWLRDAEETK